MFDFLQGYTKRMKNVGAHAFIHKNSMQKTTLKNFGFEEWYEQATKAYGKPISEFNPSAIIAQRDYPDYEPIYHDSFLECRASFDHLQSDLSGYRFPYLAE